jgi:transposase
MPKPKQRKLNEVNRSHTPLDVNRTSIVVVELSHKSWLVVGLIPGVERQPIKKLEPGEKGLLDLLNCWHKQAEKAGHRIDRIAKTDHLAGSRPSRRRMPTLNL